MRHEVARAPSRRARVALVLTAAVLPLAPGPAAALAPTTVAVRHDGDTGESRLVVLAAAGAGVNDVGLALHLGDEPVAVVEDAAAGVAAGSPECAQVSGTQVRCRLSGVDGVRADTRDGDDRLTLELVGSGGGGACTVACEVVLETGAGADVVRGFEPADVEDSTVGRLKVGTGSGDDRVLLDLQGLADSAPDVSVDLGAGADTARVLGPSGGSSADIMEGVRFVVGGPGRDRVELEGVGAARGGDDEDVLVGGRGPQRLFGGRDDDLLSGGEGEGDLCQGGHGVDTFAEDCESTAG